MGKLTAVDLFVGHIGAIVGAVAEFDALDALGSTAGWSFGAQEFVIGASTLGAVLLVPTVGTVRVAVAVPHVGNAQPVAATELVSVTRREICRTKPNAIFKTELFLLLLQLG